MHQNWKQNVEIGHNMLRKSAGHMHCHMINPNGVSLADEASAFKWMGESIYTQNSNYNGFMEHNLDTLCGKITRTIHETMRKHFTHSKVTLASSYVSVRLFQARRDNELNTGQYGGLCHRKWQQ
eukprot:8921220-Ditylum_brightwellii.AAC.1